MTEQEQIEEMVNVMIASDNPFVDVPIEIMPKVAKALYNAGYRKVSEEAVVLTEEEYTNFKSMADKYDPFWFCSVSGCEGVCKECKDICEKSIFVQERKKIAKEIIKDIEDRLKSLCKLCGAIEEFHIKYIKHSMAVTYGVEVEK